MEWDAIIVGGGHNGLTAAAYLSLAGKRVLVLERLVTGATPASSSDVMRLPLPARFAH